MSTEQLIQRLEEIKKWMDKPNWRIVKDKIDELYDEVTKTSD